MKSIFNGFVIFCLIFLSACSASNDVVSHRFIQKRKYRNGFFVDLLKTRKATSEQKTAENIAFQEIVPEKGKQKISASKIEVSEEQNLQPKLSPKVEKQETQSKKRALVLVRKDLKATPAPKEVSFILDDVEEPSQETKNGRKAIVFAILAAISFLIKIAVLVFGFTSPLFLINTILFLIFLVLAAIFGYRSHKMNKLAKTAYYTAIVLAVSNSILSFVRYAIAIINYFK